MDADDPDSQPRSFKRGESFGYVVNHLGRLFARALETRLAALGVPLGQFPLLIAFWEEDGLTQSEIARRLDLEQPTVANTLRRMQRDGLVTPSPDPDNRRRVLFHLTDRGRALEQPLMAQARAANSAASATLEPAEAETLLALMRKMIAGFKR